MIFWFQGGNAFPLFYDSMLNVRFIFFHASVYPVKNLKSFHLRSVISWRYIISNVILPSSSYTVLLLLQNLTTNTVSGNVNTNYALVNENLQVWRDTSSKFYFILWFVQLRTTHFCFLNFIYSFSKKFLFLNVTDEISCRSDELKRIRKKRLN